MTIQSWTLTTLLLGVGAFYTFVSVYALVELAVRRVRKNREDA